MEPLEASVRNQLGLFVNGYLSADRLNDLLPDTFELDEAGDPALMALVMRAIGYLAEYQAGDRQEEDVRRALAPDASWTSNGGTFSAVTRPDGSAEPQVRVAVGRRLQAVF